MDVGWRGVGWKGCKGVGVVWEGMEKGGGRMWGEGWEVGRRVVRSEVDGQVGGWWEVGKDVGAGFKDGLAWVYRIPRG